MNIGGVNKIKNKNMENNNNFGLKFLFLIWFVMFIAKTTGHFDADWWIVFLPLAPIIFLIGLVFVVSLFISALAILGCIIMGIWYLILEIYEKIS